MDIRAALMDRIKQQHEEAIRALHAELERAIFDPPSARLERMARAAGRTTFGNILTPSEDPLAGLRAVMGDPR